MKQIFKSRERLWVSLFIISFAILLVTPQLFTRKVILGSDSIFHYNRFYEAAMQLKNGNFSYFLSLYGFQQSGRIVNALYGPFFAYLQGGLGSVIRLFLGYCYIYWLNLQCMRYLSSVKLRQALLCH